MTYYFWPWPAREGQEPPLPSLADAHAFTLANASSGANFHFTNHFVADYDWYAKFMIFCTQLYAICCNPCASKFRVHITTG
jgi:hypothetical protein